MSVVLTVKVEGLIRPPLAQMASTKAYYKLGLNAYFVVPGAQKSNQITNSMAISSLYFTRILFSLTGPHRQPARENK